MNIPDFADNVLLPIAISEDNFLEFSFGVDILQNSVNNRMCEVDFTLFQTFFILLGYELANLHISVGFHYNSIKIYIIKAQFT